jgi:lipid-binding SYLF domain-containing protein
MRLHKLFTIAAVALSFAAGGAFAQDAKGKKQAEIRKVTQASMEKFYKAKPELKADVEKAPGYAVFTTYGLSFVIGGAGGTGLAIDNKTKKESFMNMAQGSAGAQLGAAQSETLIVFQSQKALDDFIDKGWSGSGGAAIQAGAGGKSVGPASGSTATAHSQIYTLTKNGLQVGLAVAGTKFWKDKDLN